MRGIIKKLKQYQQEQCDSIKIDSEYAQIIIEALEKQIPQEPLNIEDHVWGCPWCGNHLMPKWLEYPIELMPVSVGFPHCPCCGQKIDWSDEEGGEGNG